MAAPDEHARMLRDAASAMLSRSDVSRRTKAAKALAEAVDAYDAADRRGLITSYVPRGIYDRAIADNDRLRKIIEDAGMEADDDG